jgi:hypothetical protein
MSASTPDSGLKAGIGLGPVRAITGGVLEPFPKCPVNLRDRWRTIAMRYLAAIALAAFVAGAGLTVYSVGSLPSEKQLAARLAQSVEPFLPQSGG